MSGTSTPQSTLPSNPSPQAPYRIIGFIKHHAIVEHRLDIERRLIDEGFSIVKERQMQFNADSDIEFLQELFGNDALSLGEEPVWVYVLERVRATETLDALVGPEDPAKAKTEAPNSLRALYGVDDIHNVFGRSIDHSAVDLLFASSPVWSLKDLPADRFDSVRSVASSVLAALKRGSAPEQDSDAALYAKSYRTSNNGSAPSTPGQSASSPLRPMNGTNNKPAFKARPVPATNSPGSVQPRITKAAALRMGIPYTTSPPRSRESSEKPENKFSPHVPGQKRATPIVVASVAPPTIAPRPTKASALREGKPLPLPRARASLDGPRPTFVGVPGHKRSETIEVASVKAPTVAPRANRSSMLRVTKDNAPPSSFMFKLPVEPKRPGALTNKTSSSSLSSTGSGPRPSLSRRSSSALGERPPSVTARAPDIAPRMNRSAMLRQSIGLTPAKTTRV